MATSGTAVVTPSHSKRPRVRTGRRATVKYAKTLVALAAVAATVVPVLRSAGAESAPTRGRIPESSFRAGLTRANVPDFIVAYGRDGDPAGYVRADDMFPQDGK